MIVAITSSSVREPIPSLALSNAVRPGLIGWLKTLARELGPDGVTVNAIAPGRIATDRLREVYGDAGPSEADLEGDPAAPDRRAAGGGRGRGLPRLRPGRVRDGDRRPRGRRPHARVALGAAAFRCVLTVLGVALLMVVGALSFVRTSDYMIMPDRAKPLAETVTVQGEKPGGPGGIYYVDVLVRRASVLERLFRRSGRTETEPCCRTMRSSRRAPRTPTGHAWRCARWTGRSRSPQPSR